MTNFKELFESLPKDSNKATFYHIKGFDITVTFAGDDSDIEVYDKEKEEVITDEIGIPEKEVKKILKKYNLK